MIMTTALITDMFLQGYRYLSGIGVEAKCETALQYYKKVATTGGFNILIKLGICNVETNK